MRILYLDIDALRADHLGCYGYPRNTSPTIDQIAREGLRCDNVYCADAPCLPSRTGFYSGRLGIQTGVVGHGSYSAQPKLQPDRSFRDWFDTDGLARQLQLAGLHTAMISPFGQRHAAHWFYAGFNEIHNTGKGGMESAEDVQPVVEKWLGDHVGEDNWYLHINYWDPHTPYRAPSDYGNPFSDEPLPEPFTQELIDRWRHKTGPHSPKDLGMYSGAASPQHPRVPDTIEDLDSLKQWIDGYDTAIRYVDDQVRAIVDRLKAAGVYDETAIIISADHAENQGELGIFGEHGTADHGTCRIPMIVKWPGGVAGQSDDGLHYQLDWAPTMMDLLGRQKPEIWDGRSYAPAVSQGSEAGREDLVISQCAHVCQRSVRFGKWLYMRTYHDGFHLFPKQMLFDLDNDPYEQHDVAEQHPELCLEGVARLSDWHDEQMWKMSQTASNVTDPLWTTITDGGPFHARHAAPPFHLKQYLPRLEQTGREDGAEALRKRYARFLDQDE